MQLKTGGEMRGLASCGSKLTAYLLVLTCAFWTSINTRLEASTGAEICQDAARYAASKTGVPVTILQAISLTETGRKKNGEFAPWPWTVNMEGKGVWFDSRQAAFDYATKNFDRGARSFDVGCFQLNFRWHGKAFPSLEAMFDPNANAIYAAKYLLTLYAEMGNWESAVGAYHSRTPKLANKYKKRFARIHARISGSEALPKTAKVGFEPTAKKTKVNGYPLLQTVDTAPRTNGSLFSLSTRNGSVLLLQSKGQLF
jgi:transglycosylase-like protein with SLT domain